MKYEVRWYDYDHVWALSGTLGNKTHGVRTIAAKRWRATKRIPPRFVVRCKMLLKKTFPWVGRKPHKRWRAK